MKIVVAIPCGKAPSAEHLLGVATAAPSVEFCLSIPTGQPTPFVEGVTIHRINHSNVPWEVQNDERIRQYMNTILAPLANFVDGFIAEEDRILFLHDNIPGQIAFDKILDKSVLYPQLGFVSVAPRTREGFPEYRDYSSRCLAWNKSAIVQFMGAGVPDGASLGGSSMSYYMARMDEAGVPYIWTNIRCQETYTPPPPPEI